MREPNFGFLFVGMIALVVGVPALETALGHDAVIAKPLGVSALLLGGVWTLADARLGFRLGIALLVASVGTTVLAYLNPSPALSLASIAIAWVFCLLSVLLCLRHVLSRGRVTLNHLLGATCVYLLLGVLWGLTYAGIHAVDPGAFRTSDGASHVDVGTFMYFSFITLTTTGYGDIVPVGRLVRTFASLEGVAGQLYVAILVATLVSRYVLPLAEPPSRDGGA
jgi:hypothetical protein